MFIVFNIMLNRVYKDGVIFVYYENGKFDFFCFYYLDQCVISCDGYGCLKLWVY